LKEIGGPLLNRATAKATDATVFPDWVAGVRLGDSSGSSSLPQSADWAFSLNGYGPWKRGLDVVLGVLGLLLSSPIMFVAAVAIKFSTPGPVFFTQERIGLDRRNGQRRSPAAPDRSDDRRISERRESSRVGRPFTLYKFRSMVQGAENGCPKWTSHNDPRITRVGRVMRKTRIDEIPQFINVLKGDMSIVGPRPEREFFYAKVGAEIPHFRLRLKTKPGLTGLAQVNVGYCNTVSDMHRKLVHDLDYIRSASPATDAKILLRTVSVVVTGRGAY
jgi:lipopolysaccharide/colanic/teichoic acid biosynthesis glycosyltransferase